jgi:hypothetical protein
MSGLDLPVKLAKRRSLAATRTSGVPGVYPYLKVARAA